MEWLQMQTRKRVLQEWKKSFKVRLVFVHSKIPMEVRKTFKKDLHVPIMFTLHTRWCYSGQRKFSTFPSKKIQFFSLCRSRSLSLSKPSIVEERSPKNRYCWNKEETAQNCSPKRKNLREKKKFVFGFLTRKWKVGSWWIKRWYLLLCKDLHWARPV